MGSSLDPRHLADWAFPGVDCQAQLLHLEKDGDLRIGGSASVGRRPAVHQGTLLRVNVLEQSECFDNDF